MVFQAFNDGIGSVASTIYDNFYKADVEQVYSSRSQPGFWGTFFLGTNQDRKAVKVAEIKAAISYNIKALLFNTSVALAIINSLGLILGSVSPLTPLFFIATAFFIDQAMDQTFLGTMQKIFAHTPDIPFFKPVYLFSMPEVA